MNTNDIIKALEHCTTYGVGCKGCPAYGEDGKSKCKKYFRGSIDLIKRQQEEIGVAREEKLKHFLAYEKDRKRVKSEAIKEFAERLKLESDYICGSICKAIYVDEIDNILKEMVGD